MTTIELINERDNLRRKGVDIIVEPYRCGRHAFNRRYTYKTFYRTEDGSMNDSGPTYVLGVYDTYDEALKTAIKDAKRTLEDIAKRNTN